MPVRNLNCPIGAAAKAIALIFTIGFVSLMASAATRYVDLNNPAPAAPYTSWATAATNIQDAVDAATVPGALVLVSNGVYQSGARAVYGMSNRVAVTKAVTVRSVNGPAVTSILGYQVPGTTNGPAAVRCAYLASGALLSGFTLTNGATQSSGDAFTNQSAGAVWCESWSAVVSNCVLTRSSAYYSCGGAYSGALNNCALTGNSAPLGGGASGCTLNNCALTGNSADSHGGGAYLGTLNNCSLTGNSAPGGGGAEDCTLTNCTLTRNSASSGGGGASGGTLYNCTLTGNSANLYGGGASSGTLNNCIVYYNTAPSGSNYDSSALNYCCTTPLPAGPGNFSNPPLLVNTNGWSNLRLQASSPCINVGNNAYSLSPTDLDGRPRVVGGAVDVGAYEFQPGTSGLFIGWLQAYGLPTDGSADFSDSDGDGMNNWKEWVAGTEPTNALSVLRMLSATWAGSGATVVWSSVTNRSYALEQATNLGAAPAFSVLRSNIPGQFGTTSWTDTNAPGAARRFYRVRVEN